MEQNNLEKPDTSQTDWGGTLGGPILKDRMHFFYSLDRLVYAEGRSNTFTARPELDYSNTQRMKLWNHMVRVDHQLNSNNSWSARYLSENSPTYDRIAGRRAQVAKDQEFDIDRTMVATWSSVFGNTRFNTLRAAYTWEKNGFTAKEVQDGIPMTQLPLIADHVDVPGRLRQRRAVPHQWRVRSERFLLVVRAGDCGAGRTTSSSAGSTFIRPSSCPTRPT